MKRAFNSDVWFNWQQPAAPYLLGPTIDACGAPFREMFGFPFFTSIVYYRTIDADRGYQASWLLRLDEGKACGRLLHDLLAVPSFRPWFDDVVEARFTTIATAAHELSSANLPEFTDAALVERFRAYYDDFVRFYTVGAVTEPVQWRAESVFREYAARARQLGRVIAPEGWSSERIERAVFSLGTEPYARAIERDLLGVARAIEEAPACEYESSPPDRDAVSRQLLDVPAVRRAADTHIERYGWKANNYRAVSVLTAEDVVSEVLETAGPDGSAADAIDRHLAASDERMLDAASDRAEVLVHAPEAVRIAIEVGEQYGSRLADRRKAVMLQALHGLDVLGREFARRASLAYDDFVLLTPQEIETFIDHPETYASRWQSRREALVLVSSPAPLENAEMVAHLELAAGEPCVPRKDDVSLAEGQAGAELLDELDLRMGLFDDEDARAVAHGEVVTAPTGVKVVEGTCRIVTDPRHDDLVPGEILVATSTTPDFMPAIRHARALIVDQGGVLSHAALTSRELNKPCIIGTSIATALFRTGDTVRIDFDAGTAMRVDPVRQAR